MNRKWMWFAVMQMLIGSGIGAADQSNGPQNGRPALYADALHGSGLLLHPADPNGTRQVTVPEGDGAPVITDGIFSPGEWDDSLPIAVNETVVLRLKHYRGVVFIGVHSLNTRNVSIGPSEVFLAVPGGQINRLHVSAQLYETALPPAGSEPAARFGFTPDWYANELRRDMIESQRLEKEGRSPYEVLRAASYPSDGIEFAIRRSKLPGQQWLMRLWISAFMGDKPGSLLYPAAAAERSTEGWLELHFK